jgi:hypothetical protein
VDTHLDGFGRCAGLVICAQRARCAEPKAYSLAWLAQGCLRAFSLRVDGGLCVAGGAEAYERKLGVEDTVPRCGEPGSGLVQTGPDVKTLLFSVIAVAPAGFRTTARWKGTDSSIM